MRSRHKTTSLISEIALFSSIRRHTRLTCDWSSDVCSSDLDSILPFMALTMISVLPESMRPAVLGNSGMVSAIEERQSEFRWKQRMTEEDIWKTGDRPLTLIHIKFVRHFLKQFVGTDFIQRTSAGVTMFRFRAAVCRF